MDTWEKIQKIEKFFEDHDDDYLEFEDVKDRYSQRPDLHALIMLDKIFPDKHDIICNAEHDQFWIDIDDEQIITLTEDQLLDLIRCGIRLDDGFYMFV